MTAYPAQTRTTLGHLCVGLRDSQSRPDVIQPLIKPRTVVMPLALRCSALDHCTTRELALILHNLINSLWGGGCVAWSHVYLCIKFCFFAGVCKRTKRIQGLPEWPGEDEGGLGSGWLAPHGRYWEVAACKYCQLYIQLYTRLRFLMFFFKSASSFPILILETQSLGMMTWLVEATVASAMAKTKMCTPLGPQDQDWQTLS